jgi:hypothetical protein
VSRVVVAVGLLLAVGAAAARAEHEVFYRYTVLGYIKDAAGRAVAGQRVELVRDKTGFSYLGETDSQGLFVLIARLGDESRGEALTLRVGGARFRLQARFEPANRTDERGTRVDVEAARFVERPAWFRSTLANFLGSPSR